MTIPLVMPRGGGEFVVSLPRLPGFRRAGGGYGRPRSVRIVSVSTRTEAYWKLSHYSDEYVRRVETVTTITAACSCRAAEVVRPRTCWHVYAAYAVWARGQTTV